MAIRELTKVSGIIPSSLLHDDFALGTSDEDVSALLEARTSLNALQTSINEVLLSLEWSSLEDFFGSDVGHVIALNSRLRDFDFLEGSGALGPIDQVEKWAEEVLMLSGGMEERLFRIHDLVTGKALFRGKRQKCLLEEFQEKLEERSVAGRNPGQSPKWYMQAFVSSLSGIQASGFLSYCTALNIKGESHGIENWNQKMKHQFEEQKELMVRAIDSSQSQFFYPFPIDRSHGRLIDSIDLGETWKINDKKYFDLNEVSSNEPVCGARLYRKGNQVAISVERLHGYTPNSVSKQIGTGREWMTSSEDCLNVAQDVEYVFCGWMRVPNPDKQCICGVGFCELGASIALRILVIDKEDTEWEGASFWVEPQESNGEKMMLGPKKWDTHRLPAKKRNLKLFDNILFESPISPPKTGFVTGIRLSLLYRKKKHALASTSGRLLGF
ncbi:hypothetical protein BSKO_10944 [Bryopsis sp. KO-2023]|nr:hypothetical protein BSKO_10944 [Bryopsis sp. KO-2023]